MATEFFITLGFNASRFDHNNIDTFTQAWATREFALPQDKAMAVTEIMNNVTRWNARRKPELLNATTYSLINYRERVLISNFLHSQLNGCFRADTVMANWDATVAASTSIYNSLSSAMKPAFFQLVHHPVLASANVQKMLIAAGQNNLFGSQARLSTNDLADQASALATYPLLFLFRLTSKLG